MLELHMKSLECQARKASEFYKQLEATKVSELLGQHYGERQRVN